ncbi:MAG: hypothetical protein FWD67_02480 [Betaproteobacteria bacterium]|nr:hypothetical protein [Betaproteobacteria bacterium]
MDCPLFTHSGKHGGLSGHCPGLQRLLQVHNPEGTVASCLQCRPLAMLTQPRWGIPRAWHIKRTVP